MSMEEAALRWVQGQTITEDEALLVAHAYLRLRTAAQAAVDACDRGKAWDVDVSGFSDRLQRPIVSGWRLNEPVTAAIGALAAELKEQG